MPRFSPILTNFTAGELSPRLEGRVDLARYANGCRTLENMLVLPHGGATRRGGTRYVADVTAASEPPRLVPFEFSVEQAYILEFGSFSLRFFADQGQVVAAATDAAITNGGFSTDLSGWTAASVTWDASSARFAASGTLTQAVTHTKAGVEHVMRFNVGGTAGTDAVDLRIGTTSGGQDILSDVTFGPGQHCYSFTPTASPMYVQFRHNTGTAALDGVFIINDAPIEISTIYAEADVATLAYAQSADVLYLAHQGHEPRKLLRLGAARWSLAEIAFTGKPTEWTGTNHPGAVAFYEQRLYWAGTPNEPQTLWGSKNGDFENLTTGANDDDAVKYTIATDQVNVIRWLSPGTRLAIGTAGGEFVASGSGVDEAITPGSIRIVRQTTYGSKAVRPLRIGNVVLFVQRQGRKVREFVYAFESDAYVGPDLTLLAEHVTKGGLVETAYQTEPDSILWAVRSDGALLGMTYERDQQVVAWHRHVLGGSFDGGAAVVESIAVIPGQGRDELWLAVKRTVNGATARTVELMTAGLEDGEAQEDAFFVDAGLTYAGGPATVISGLDHLAGETVAILADGAVLPDAKVTGGQVTLPVAASKVHIGLPFTWTLAPMRVDGGNPAGTAQGKRKRIEAVTMRLYRSLGVTVGPDAASLDELSLRTSADPMGDPPGLFTGDVEVAFNDGWGRDGLIVLSGSQPLPATILAVMADVKVSA